MRLNKPLKIGCFFLNEEQLKFQNLGIAAPEEEDEVRPCYFLEIAYFHPYNYNGEFKALIGSNGETFVSEMNFDEVSKEIIENLSR